MPSEMSSDTSSETSSEHAAEHGHTNYVKIWGILVVLLVISVVGPMFEIQVLTLITAFGIAVVKALIVAQKFMHIGHAPRFVTYVMVTCLVFMVLLFAGTAPDVMNPKGYNWKKDRNWQYVPDAAQHVSVEHH